MAIVKFYRGNKSSYQPETTHKDCIYFCLDEHVIYLNNVAYGFNESANKLVEDVTYENGILTVKYLDGTEDSVNDLNELLKYKSAMPDDLTVPNAIGGLQAGVKAEELKKKTISQVLDDIIFPELNPTVTAPSASISLKDGFSANRIYEVGAPAPVAETNFNTGFNRGKGVVAGQPDKYRAGELNPEASFIYYGGSTTNKELPAEITLGSLVYNYHAEYAEGDTLVTSKGSKATRDSANKSLTNPLTAGSVNSGGVTIYGTYPYFCNGASASSSNQESSLPTEVTSNTKLPLQKWSDTLVGAKFASEASTKTRLLFEFPSTKKVTKVEFMNTVSGKWEAFTAYTTGSAGNKTIQETEIAYSNLTTNGALSGALQLRFTIANA